VIYEIMESDKAPKRTL